MVLFLFQHTEGDKAALKQVPFQIRDRPSALPKGALHEAMSGIKGVLEEPSRQTVTKIFDRCRDAVTTAGEKCRASPGDRATACGGGRGASRRPAAPDHAMGVSEDPEQTPPKFPIRIWLAKCSRLQTVSDGLTNKVHFEPTIGSCTLLVTSGESMVRISPTPGSTSTPRARAIIYDCTLASVASPSHQARGPTTAVVTWVARRQLIGPASPRAPVGAAHPPARGVTSAGNDG